MNIFGVGPMEMLLIAVIAVVVLGPERFPQAAVQFAKALKFLRGYATEATSDLRSEFAELTKEYEGLRTELNEIRSGVYKSVDTVAATLTQAHGEAASSIKSVVDKVPGKGELRQMLSGAPIIEPGGELPPDRANGTNGTGSSNGSGPAH
ncbi:MAG: twin-arginine translocase TatA/TatE family subunit [Chloroflexota bacterium]